MKSKILYFMGGVVAGSLSTYFVLRRRMERRMNAEIEEVKETYSSRKALRNDSEASEGRSERTVVDASTIARLNEQKKADILKNANILEENKYGKIEPTPYNLFSNPPKAKDIHNGQDEDEDLEVYLDHPREDLAERPYTITPTQFINEEPFFDKITLEYYDDGVMANALTEEIVEDVDRFVGLESLEKFGEFEDDVVFVRNEHFRTDYEVIRQHRPFANIPEEYD